MHILCLSDTHLDRNESLPAPLLAAAERADRILHAGDLTSASVLDALAVYAPVEAVAGNMDPAPLAAAFPAKKMLAFGGVHVGLIHGWGPPDGIQRRILAELPHAQVIVFGHTHQPTITDHDGVLLLNPGSPTDNRFAPYRSYAWLEIGQDQPRATIVRLPGN